MYPLRVGSVYGLHLISASTQGAHGQSTEHTVHQDS